VAEAKEVMAAAAVAKEVMAEAANRADTEAQNKVAATEVPNQLGDPSRIDPRST
jgi:hypothetical protein